MRHRRGVWSALSTALLVTVAVVADAAPAAADAFGSGGPPPPPPTSESETRTTSGGCRMYASSSGYGMVCPAPGGGSLKQVLDGDDVPTCWHEDPPPTFVPEMELLPGDPRRWYLQACVSGFDANAVQIGRLRFSFDFVPLLPTEVVRLTENQREFTTRIQRNAQIPLPVVQNAPSGSPRVDDDTAFYVLEEYTEAPTIAFDDRQMRARQVYLTVEPEGAVPVSTSCPGAGVRVTAEDTRGTRPDACWHTYRRSSNDLSRGTFYDRYRAFVTAYWTVEYSEDGGATWTELGTFEKEAMAGIRVTEIQTLVVR